MTIEIKADAARRGYVLRASSVVPRLLEEVFAFFSDAVNLQALTPSCLRFEVLTPPQAVQLCIDSW